MPTQTFLNLPGEKRARIIDAAISEFSNHQFNDVSVAKIIEKAEIPRGSFYQYFTDLKDLYRYLFDIIIERKLVFLHKAQEGFQSNDIFEIIKNLYLGGLQFAASEPELAKIGNMFYKEPENFRKEIMGGLEGKTTDFYLNLLKASYDKGEIDPEVDLEMAAFLFTTMNLSIIDFFIAKTNKTDLLSNKEFMIETINKMFYILTNGVKKK